MKKEINIGIIMVFVVGMCIMPASAIFPPDICGEEYYFNDYHRISDTTTAEEFGNYEKGNPSNSYGLLKEWMENNYIFDKNGCTVYWDTVEPDYFMCGHWAAHYEWFLENMGFDAKIYKESRHAYAGVRLSDGWHIIDATIVNDPGGIMDPPGHSPQTTYTKINSIPGSAEAYYDWYDYGLNWGLNRATHDMNIMPIQSQYNGEAKAAISNYGGNAYWHVDENGDEIEDYGFFYGSFDMEPTVGDSNGNGYDEKCSVSIYGGNAYWHVYGGNNFWYGQSGDKFAIGDVTGDGNDEVCYIRNEGGNAHWYCDTNYDRISDYNFYYGNFDMKFAVGEVGNDGDDDICAISNYGGNAYWHVDENMDGIEDYGFAYGNFDMKFAVGDI